MFDRSANARTFFVTDSRIQRRGQWNGHTNFLRLIFDKDEVAHAGELDDHDAAASW